jgi:hypothetical protein
VDMAAATKVGIAGTTDRALAMIILAPLAAC